MSFGRKNSKSTFLIFSWALYDLANQFFALNVIALYFPLWLTIEKNTPEIFYSIAFGISMIFVAICAPVLGVISDAIQRRKIFLIYFTFLSIVFTIGLGFSVNVFIALLFFVIANFGCQTAVVFYNALMVDVVKGGRIGFVSGLGRMCGYSGALIALYSSKPIIAKFGYQATFLLSGILFFIFSLPCMLFVREQKVNVSQSLLQALGKIKLKDVFKKLKNTAFNTTNPSGFNNFLKAAFFWLCAVNAIILFMSVYVTKVFDLGEAQVIDLLVFSTFFAILGSIFSGFLCDRIGYKRSLNLAFFLWGICIITGALLSPPFHWLIGALAGLSLGATWVIFRAAVIELVPKQNIGQAFGLFNLAGYAAGVMGSLFWGLMVLSLSFLGHWGHRLTLLGLILFIGLGFFFFRKVPDEGIKLEQRL